MIDYKIKQKEYKKAINVILEIAERKKDQVLTEPKEKMWKIHLESLLVARECIEEDIPYLNPNY
tara:strand:+ start:170 stop:361 length:192 start_codon:yes stop_codon:yes gene_type:complete